MVINLFIVKEKIFIYFLVKTEKKEKLLSLFLLMFTIVLFGIPNIDSSIMYFNKFYKIFPSCH